MSSSLPYKQFQVCHPEYTPQYWGRCRALYAGGRRLLARGPVLEEVLPRHNAELQPIYDERCGRAYYLNYAGSVIDLIAAGLFEESPYAEATPEPDKWYEDWFSDVSRPGGQRMAFNDLLKAQVIAALTLKRAWTLVELPGATLEPPTNLAEQEKAGALDAYASPVDPECVRDWERDEDGALAWALLAFKRQKRAGLQSDRKRVEEEFVYYTPESFQRYVIEYNADKPPGENAPVPLVEEGAHSFGKVPLAVLELTDGMWAMGKLESVAAAHMNTVNALSWATLKSLFPTPTAFLAPMEQGNEIDETKEDPDRGQNQARGPANVVTLSDKDRFEFIGPSSEPFKHAMEQADRLRDEMYRVVHSMAASVDNSGAALQRSGESKSMDLRHTSVVLKWLGQRLAEHAVEILKLVQAGRGDPEAEWTVHGMEEFDAPDMDQVLKEAQAIDTISIPSATFQRMYKFKVAKEALGDDADGETLEEIQGELEANITNEQFTMPAMTPDSPGNPGDDDEDEEDTTPDKAPQAEMPKKKARKPKAEKKAA